MLHILPVSIILGSKILICCQGNRKVKGTPQLFPSMGSSLAKEIIGSFSSFSGEIIYHKNTHWDQNQQCFSPNKYVVNTYCLFFVFFGRVVIW